MKFNLIGAGRLGKNIVAALPDNIGAVCNSNIDSARMAVSLTGCGTAVARVDDLPPADITFITTPDDIIPVVVRALLDTKVLTEGSIVVHCSGVLSSEILTSLRERSCKIASFHPLKAFSAGTVSKTIFNQCYCVLEGDSDALGVLTHLFKPTDALLMTMNADKKAAYHAAAVMASNYLVTLAANSVDLLQEAGIEASIAQKMITQLMEGSLANVKKADFVASALTGPLVRGDIATIDYHLQALRDLPSLPLYTAAAHATLPLTALTMEKKLAITQLLLEFS